MPELKTSDYSGFCPHCGYKLEAATSFEGKTPHEGAITLCIKCGEWSFMTIGSSLRKPTGFEMIEIAGDPNAIKMKIAWQHMKAERTKRERANSKRDSRGRG